VLRAFNSFNLSKTVNASLISRAGKYQNPAKDVR
jgi:hypothetical protein